MFPSLLALFLTILINNQLLLAIKTSSSSEDTCSSFIKTKYCECFASEIHCSSLLNDLILKSVFILKQPKAFSSLSIFQSKVTVLPRNLFKGPTFRKFYLHHNKQLYKVEDNAFKGSEETAEVVYLHSCSLSDTSVFRAIARLNNLREVFLGDNLLMIIPDFAFGNQPKLSIISLANNKIKVMGQMAFVQLTSLTYLSLSSNEIDRLDDDTFSIMSTNSSPTAMTIILKQNKIQNIKTFAFRGLDRAVNLGLSFNRISKLEEKTFKQILPHYMTKIILKGNPIECDCGIYWILSNPNYGSKFSGPIRCSNKAYYNSLKLKDFEKCKGRLRKV